MITKDPILTQSNSNLNRTSVSWLRVDIKWQASTVSGMPAFAAVTQLMTAIGIGWGISWLNFASDYTRFAKPSLGAGKVFPCDLPRHVPADGLGFSDGSLHRYPAVGFVEVRAVAM